MLALLLPRPTLFKPLPQTEARLPLANTQCLSKDETPSPRARSTEVSTAGKNPTNFPARLSIISTSEREENKSVLILHPYTSYKNRNTSRTPPTITTSTTHFYSFTTCTTCINISTTNPFTISPLTLGSCNISRNS